MADLRTIKRRRRTFACLLPVVVIRAAAAALAGLDFSRSSNSQYTGVI
jgi:hypothetical protein